MAAAIKIENLSKQYRLGLVGTGTLSHDLRRWWYLVRGKEDPYLKIGDINDRSTKGFSEYIWALKDINLEVQQGEVMGIIGKNGAGKSTLLKILSKVTAPTTGSVSYKGRIGSLLEVGTGFHPELTGRENIYLNGAILGMRKKEIEYKFDEIVDFSGCERYIDTPVKRYSSGMTVRLGFAVAAFLEPEILVVDEVLAVGDAEFQKKAIGKIQDVSKNEGRTVLFVSHNMASIKALCTSCVYLQNAKIVNIGEVKDIISQYLQSNNSLFFEQDLKDIKREGKNGKDAIITSFKILNSKLEISNSVFFGESFSFEITSIVKTSNIKSAVFGVRFEDENENYILSTLSSDVNIFYDINNQSETIARVKIDVRLVPGKYYLTLSIRKDNLFIDQLRRIAILEILNIPYEKVKPHNGTWGFIQIYPEWA